MTWNKCPVAQPHKRRVCIFGFPNSWIILNLHVCCWLEQHNLQPEVIRHPRTELHQQTRRAEWRGKGPSSPWLDSTFQECCWSLDVSGDVELLLNSQQHAVTETLQRKCSGLSGPILGWGFAHRRRPLAHTFSATHQESRLKQVQHLHAFAANLLTHTKPAVSKPW